MATFTAIRAGATKTAAAVGWASDVKSAWGTIEFGATAVPTIADTFVMAKLPKGAVIIGGALMGDKLETTSVGSGLLNLNIGVDKAVITPTGTTVNAASASNVLASNWVLGSDTIANLTQFYGSANRNIALGGLLLSEGPLLLTDDANAQITVMASSLVTTTGTLTLRVDYYMGIHA